MVTLFHGCYCCNRLLFFTKPDSLGIGISAFPESSAGQTAFAVGRFIGLTICSFLAMFPAGYIAAKLGRAYCLTLRTGELYGIAAWGVGLIVTILLGSWISNFISQSRYVVGRQSINIRMVELNNSDTYLTHQTASRNTNGGTTTKVQVDPDRAAQVAGMLTFATFFILFFGLISTCFCGRCAMMCGKKEISNKTHCLECHKH
jgi:hypothetical protein